MKKISQKKKILNHLKAGEPMTSYGGFRMGIVRLTNRIGELIAEGYPIRSRWATSLEGARYKVYYMSDINE